MGVWRWNIAQQKQVLLGSDSPIINVYYLLSKDTVPLVFLATGILGSGLNTLTCHRLFHYASAHMNKIYWAQFQGAIVGISTIVENRRKENRLL